VTVSGWLLYRSSVRVAGVVLTSALLTACAPGSNADPIATADSIVRDWVASNRIPGAVLRISESGELQFESAYGFAQRFDYGTGQYPQEAQNADDIPQSKASRPEITRSAVPTPMTMQTVFDLASVTKVMATTMAAMLLVDRGQLDVDAPVSTYLPDFSADQKTDLTIKDLLTHRAGLDQWQPTYYHATNAAEAYAFIRDLPLSWSPGTELHYSDLGFMVLGLVVEGVTGQRLDAFLENELYEPLGLDRTAFRPRDDLARDPGGRESFAATSHGNPFERRMVHDPDFGYRIGGDPNSWDGWRTRTLVGEVNDGNAFHTFQGIAGHAGLFSTAADLDVLLQLLLARGRWNGQRVLSPEVVDRFLETTGDGQALGWQIPPYAPPSSFGHTGFTGTFVLGVRDRSLSIVLLTNRQNGGVDDATQYPDIGELQREVTRALVGNR